MFLVCQVPKQGWVTCMLFTLSPALRFLYFAFLHTLNPTKSQQTSRSKTNMASSNHTEKTNCHDTDPNTMMASDIEKTAAITLPPPAYSPPMKQNPYPVQVPAINVGDSQTLPRPSDREIFCESLCILCEMIYVGIRGCVASPQWRVERLRKIQSRLDEIEESLDAHGGSRAGGGS